MPRKKSMKDFPNGLASGIDNDDYSILKTTTEMTALYLLLERKCVEMKVNGIQNYRISFHSKDVIITHGWVFFNYKTKEDQLNHSEHLIGL